MPTRGPSRPRRGAIEELAVAFVAIAVTTLRDGMRISAVAMAIDDRATAMRDCPVTMGVIEARTSWNRGGGHTATRSVHLWASSCCARATGGSDQHAVASMLRAVQFNSRAVQFHSRAGTIRFSSDKVLDPRSTMGGPIVSLRLAERGDGVTVASNESDGGGDSVCTTTDALIVADDRRAALHDRAFALSSHPIARCDPLSDA